MYTFIISIYRDNIEGATWRTEAILTRLGVVDATSDEVQIIKHICALISYRAAALLSSC